MNIITIKNIFSRLFATHILISLCMLLMLGLANAELVTKEQIKGLDEQVQDIKKDVLGISTELNLLEEKLLFPSSTQISIFFSLEGNTSFQPDAIKVDLDSKNVAHHIYTFKEVSALQKHGVQHIYTGNIRTGEHSLQVSVIGKDGGSKKTDIASHSITKGVGPQFVEIRLTGAGVKFRNW